MLINHLSHWHTSLCDIIQHPVHSWCFDLFRAQEVLHTISSPYGVVQRIAIFRKNGVQALVEFDSNASAARAKANLEGADIYAGCCTLKTEYARVCVCSKHPLCMVTILVC